MEIKGVSYDVGRVMAGNWRPVFDPKVVQRELEIIRNDLHCNAVRICGLDISRLITAAGDGPAAGPGSVAFARDVGQKPGGNAGVYHQSGRGGGKAARSDGPSGWSCWWARS